MLQALFVPTVLASYASMVTHHFLDPSLLVHHSSEHQLPAQVRSEPFMQHHHKLSHRASRQQQLPLIKKHCRSAPCGAQLYVWRHNASLYSNVLLLC